MTTPVPNALRPGLPPLPRRIADLPVDGRGFPVPWFVAWYDGEPDHRIVDTKKMPLAIALGVCWICGQRLGAHKTFTIGPMCAVTRTISEPPSHLDCARFAAMACPFLSRPHARRRAAGLPDKLKPAAGAPIDRNPGVVALWTTRAYKVTTSRTVDSNPGMLFRLGDPDTVEWIAEGRPATRDEIIDSVESGIPILAAEAVADDAYNARQPGLHIGPADAMQRHVQRGVLDFLQVLGRTHPTTPPTAAPPQETSS
jgi:hypothetical protein